MMPVGPNSRKSRITVAGFSGQLQVEPTSMERTGP